MRRLFVFTIIPLVIALMLPTPAMAGGKLKGKTIALDAGHGGADPGAVNSNPANRINESDMTISVVDLLKKKLEADGAKVEMTRTGNDTVGLHERVAAANATGAQILISVHHNSAGPDVNGTETYFTQADDQQLAAALHPRLVQTFGLKDRGIKQMPDFVLTNRPNMPSVITEASFVTNDVEANAWINGDREEQEATALYSGIVDYFAGR